MAEFRIEIATFATIPGGRAARLRTHKRTDMISLDNLTVSYGGWTLFDNISFLINPKDRIGLVGKNGAGKTTLLRLITGEQQPTSGAVTINARRCCGSRRRSRT